MVNDLFYVSYLKCLTMCTIVSGHKVEANLLLKITYKEGVGGVMNYATYDSVLQNTAISLF